MPPHPCTPCPPPPTHTQTSQTVTWQIVSGLGQAQSFRGGSSYPSPFNYFVNAIEIFMLDFFVFFHTECVERTNYSTKLALTLLTVVALGVLATLIGAGCKCMWGGAIVRSTSFKAFIVLIYMVLPMVSSMAVSAFSCDEVGEGPTDQPTSPLSFKPTNSPTRQHPSTPTSPTPKHSANSASSTLPPNSSSTATIARSRF
jgi:hypothetical protein